MTDIDPALGEDTGHLVLKDGLRNQSFAVEQEPLLDGSSTI
jgi:hypothetical protein